MISRHFGHEKIVIFGNLLGFLVSMVSKVAILPYFTMIDGDLVEQPSDNPRVWKVASSRWIIQLNASFWLQNVKWESGWVWWVDISWYFWPLNFRVLSCGCHRILLCDSSFPIQTWESARKYLLGQRDGDSGITWSRTTIAEYMHTYRQSDRQTYTHPPIHPSIHRYIHTWVCVCVCFSIYVYAHPISFISIGSIAHEYTLYQIIYPMNPMSFDMFFLRHFNVCVAIETDQIYIVDFPINTSIDTEFYITMFDCRRVFQLNIQ